VIATGRLRAYLKHLADDSWNLVTWLEHYATATSWDADLALDATSSAIGTFGVAIHRYQAGKPPQCPRCNSYRVDYDHNYDPELDVSSENKICGACEHQWDFTRKRMVQGKGWVNVDTESATPTDEA
jgi:hypothetical protein